MSAAGARSCCDVYCCSVDTAASSADAAPSAGRLVKSTAFELFDEDANTESPTVSQQNNHDNIGLLRFVHVSVFVS